MISDSMNLLSTRVQPNEMQMQIDNNLKPNSLEFKESREKTTKPVKYKKKKRIPKANFVDVEEEEENEQLEQEKHLITVD